MSESSVGKSASEPNLADEVSSEPTTLESLNPESVPEFDSLSPGLFPTPSNASSGEQDDWEYFPPMERITPFDLLNQIQLPAQLEKWQATLSAQTDRARKQRERFAKTGRNAKDRVVEQWRRRVPAPDEQLERYRKRMRTSVDRLGKQWNQSTTVTAREKAAFIAGVLNIFLSGYLIGGNPQYFYLFYTVQFFFFMPIRFFNYHKVGYHYFLADLCYFVNGLLILAIWVFPQSKRLLISTYCLAYGNNAVAIAMWRNSLVFHSMDKVTSLFIHLMPPVTLHCMIHLTPMAFQRARFPAIYTIMYSAKSSPEHYSLGQMVMWATVPYLVWQLSYHFLITVRRREKIAAGRPTSFTWLRKSYANTWIGKLILGCPTWAQEPMFMLTQYTYAMITVIPCPLWFWYRWCSAAFLFIVFTWSVYNGSTFYIDVFGRRFQKELEQLKKDVQRWQASPGMIAADDDATPPARTESTPILESNTATGRDVGAGTGPEKRTTTTGQKDK